MFFIVAVIYIVLFFGFYTVGFVMHYKISKKSVFLSFFVFALAYGILAYHVEPPNSWDLYRHFAELNRIRSGGLYYLWHVGIYKNQIGSSLLFYLVSFLPNNHFLPFLSIIIEYSILAYIISDYCEENHLNCRYIFLILILHLGLNDISWTLSTIRQTLAMAFVALAVYLDLVKKKKIGLIFYVFGFVMHPGSIGAILIRLALILYKRKIPIHILLVMWGAFASKIAFTLIRSSVFAIQYIGSMLNEYVFSDHAEAGDSRQVVVKLILLLILLIMIWRRRNFWIDNDYIKFVFLTSVFTLGSIVSGQIFLRYILLLSYLIIPIPKLISSNTKIGSVSLSDIFFIFMFIGLMAYQYVTLTTHGLSLWFG